MDVIKDFHFGELEDGSIQLSILYADKTHRTAIVAPELLGAMLGTLMKSMFHAKDSEVRKWAQMMAIRTVSG